MSQERLAAKGWSAAGRANGGAVARFWQIGARRWFACLRHRVFATRRAKTAYDLRLGLGAANRADERALSEAFLQEAIMAYRVAVVGATGAVGREMLKTLAERNFPVSEVAAVASGRSAGTEVSYGEKRVLKVQ